MLIARLLPAAALAALLSACMPLSPLPAEAPADATAVSGRLPKADLILVKKSDRRLTLLRNGREIKSYKVSLGRNPVGQKVAAGDGRTPEGDYLIDWRKPDSKFYKALHISYPRVSDRRTAEEAGRNPGGAIMIHGLPNDRPRAHHYLPGIDWTEGCIAVTNREMDEIWHSVRDGTPIRILP